MEKKLKMLNAQRNNVIMKINSLLEYAKAIPVDEVFEGVQVRLTAAREAMASFNEIEREIICTNAEEPLKASEFDRKFYEIETRLGSWLRLNSTNVNLNMTLNDTMLGGGTNACRELKLPKSVVPIFSGEYMEWQTFYDLYCANIHDRPNLTSSQKFQFLQGYLKGEASSLIKHLRISDANYSEAIQKLRDRYSRKKQIVNSFIGTFLDQPGVNTGTAESIRKVLDTSDEMLRGLKALGNAAEARDPWIIRIVLNKLDDQTKSLWIKESKDEDFPSIKTFFKFLQDRVDELENVRSVQPPRKQIQGASKMTLRGHVSSNSGLCIWCGHDGHESMKCSVFLNWSVEERRKRVQSENLCFNCLKPNHRVFRCGSRLRCSMCGSKHNTILHVDRSITVPERAVQLTVVNEGNQNDKEVASSCSLGEVVGHTGSPLPGQAILPTAVVELADQDGNRIGRCRALLDCGSQASFIAEELVQKWRLNVTHKTMPVAGLGGTSVGKTKGSVSIMVLDSQSKPLVSLVPHILSKVTANLPHQEFDLNNFKFLRNVKLADSGFNVPGEIQLLIGADQFFNLMLDGQIKDEHNGVIAQNTKLGWVVSGQHLQSTTDSFFAGMNTLESIDESLRKLWEVEGLPKRDHLTVEEESCEQLFTATTTQKDDGRYIVRIPFKMDPMQTGDNRYQALKRLQSLEVKFRSNPELEQKYRQFMAEYISLGDMSEITVQGEEDAYFMPHHGILQHSNHGVKLRVVFDASAKGSLGYSLNETMRTGPVVQSSLYNILLRFRSNKFVFTADVQRMYRQIRVHEDDATWQKIVWRDNPGAPIKYFQLDTVTYGTRAAPYLATRVLKEIANTNKHRYPKASTSIEFDTYVDDIMTGSESEAELIQTRDEVIEMLKCSQMPLKKWLSNSRKLLNDLPPEDVDLRTRSFEETPNELMKVLGMQWDPVLDEFKFKVNLDDLVTATKRGILSEVSRVFDPLGLIAPCVVNVKILLQEIWKRKLDWDETLPPDLSSTWIQLRNGLRDIEKFGIPRWLQTLNIVEIHDFADASSDAYGAVVYAKVVDKQGDYKVTMVTSKSRVAPLKKLTIPKLELCAAVLASNLLKVVSDTFRIKIDAVYAWTDSTIVLDWLSAYPVKDVFVNNRIGAILENHSRNCWSHVSSADNPADIVSRGATPSQLLESRLWWNGPAWLSGKPDGWPQQQLRVLTVSSDKNLGDNQAHVVISGIKDLIMSLEERTTSFYKITKTLAVICKFIELTKTTKEIRKPSITVVDLERAEILMFKYIQGEEFPDSIQNIKLGRPLKNNSKLIQLNPFIDSHGVLRVGGRLARANIDFNVKHPIILSAKFGLVKLMMQEFHVKYHHAGATLMSSLLRQRFWIIGARNVLRQLVKRCVRCVRSNPKFCSQMMADLPLARVQFTRPFVKVGIDYAGPFLVTPVRRRGQRSIKSYVCIFICMATRAVHIELVTDLSTDTFLAALRRMTSRRGSCTDVFTDCGTNFIGANRKLIELFAFLRSSNHHIAELLLKDRITWHFNPPGAPHFGGSWEAAVKIMKTHLHRVLGNILPAIDEFQTLLVEIEGIMNSRPLCRTGEDDIDCLTPGHFLIGQPMSSIPERVGDEERVASTLRRWEMVQQLKRNFWTRWCQEYLSTLQRRNKWCRIESNLKIGDVVIIKDDSLAAKQYVLGKVIEVYPGIDGLVRAVKLKTRIGEVKRPIHKLCLLPSGESADSREAGCLR